MTKKNHSFAIGALVAVSLLTIVLASCVQPANAAPNAPADEFAAPSMGVPADLVASTGTAPATEVDAIALYNKVCSHLDGRLFVQNRPASIGVITSNDSNMARVSKEPEGPQSLDGERTIGNGTAKTTGSLTSMSSIPTITADTANTRYDSYRKSSVTAHSSAIIEGVTFTDENGVIYTVSGKISNKLDQFCDVDLLTGIDMTNRTDWKYFSDVSYKRTYGIALSVKTSTGAGAKFILSKAVVFSKTGIESDRSSGYRSALSTALENETATLKMYDDAGNLVRESTVLYKELSDMIDHDDFILGMSY